MTGINYKALVFDWGNTIMSADLPYRGKMKDWEKVEVIDSAFETLAHLARQSPLFLASNAKDSSASEIQEALKRVGLDSFFSGIYTAKDLREAKTNPVFYRNLSEKIGSPLDSIIMIGDNYIEDVLTPSITGMKTIWFNPRKQSAAALLPVQDMEIRSLSQLVETLNKPFLPNLATCLSFYTSRSASHALIAHVHNVAAIAYQIAVWMERSGIFCSPLLCQRGGLIHDLAKFEEAEGKNHAQTAGDFLESIGQNDLAEIARRHLISDYGDGETDPVTWDQKIVNYADKLSEGNQLITLDQRLAHLKERYPAFSEKISRNTPRVKSLEQEIVNSLGITAEELNSRLKTALYERSPHSAVEIS